MARRRERRTGSAAHGLARSDAQLLFDDVGAGDLLGHRVLHLHARVHLHEVERPALVEQELDGSSVLIVHGAHGLDGRHAHGAAQILGQGRRGRFLDELLMTTLHGAVALAQGDVVSEVVGQHLDLHVARTQHELLQVHAVVAERCPGLGARGLVLSLEIGRVVHFAHTLAAAARRGLDEHRIAHAVCERLSLGRRLDTAVGTGNGGNAARFHRLARGALVAHALDALGSRADEHEIVIGAGAGEVGVLGEEAVAGMHGFRAGGFRRGDDVGHDEVALVRLSGADAHGLVGVLHGIGVGVLGRVDRDRLHAQLLAGAHDAQRHLAAVRDENLVKHYAVSGAGAGAPWGSM